MKTKSTCVAVIALALLLCGQGVVSAQTGSTGGKDAQGARSQNLDALIRQAQDALDGKRWQEAIAPLQQITAADPTRWESFQQLGNAQLNLGRYEDSVRSYEKGVQAAQNLLSGPPGKTQDPARIKAGIGQMLTQQGNAYLKLRKNKEAVVAYTRAAEMSPNPALAYFNLCATHYNMGNMDSAEAVCDKVIALDPTRADAYFIKGSAMFGKGKLDANNKYVVPAGTAQVLKKYLELSPDGPHAGDVKAMLEMIGVK